MSLWLDAAALTLPAALGGLAGYLRVFPEPARAVDDLNRFALYVAFPALIFRGLVDSRFALPSTPGFWLLVPAAFLVTVGLTRLLTRTQAPTLALGLSFGNVAYLGLPLVESALGEAQVGLASLAVALHVTLGLSLGPYWLLQWSGHGGTPRESLRRLARQPLIWTPLVAFAARALPDPARESLEVLATPLGRAAAPSALFLLGLYLFTERARVLDVERGDLAHPLAKLLALPALTIAGALGLREIGWLTTPEAQVLCLLAGMPAAITTFSIARELGVGVERTSRAIVSTSALSALTLPGLLWLVLVWLPR
ncbi:MAG: AEC family transporter [Myxococcales bacterium]|nr:AEC family transporter [Myxococcales bacterium]